MVTSICNLKGSLQRLSQLTIDVHQSTYIVKHKVKREQEENAEESVSEYDEVESVRPTLVFNVRTRVYQSQNIKIQELFKITASPVGR